MEVFWGGKSSYCVSTIVVGAGKISCFIELIFYTLSIQLNNTRNAQMNEIISLNSKCSEEIN